MFSHVTLGIADLPRAVAFYTPLMERLGHSLRFQDADTGWAGWQPGTGARPLFILTRPIDGAPPAPGNGTMMAFLARDRATVDAVYALALSLGGRDEGAPGLRPHYHPHYYGAYFRDPEGNKLALACHDPA
ncbi:MAG: VOC family protein [Paracoccaceae bacterium]|nr:VOC family protein [Paracoccaceae bacterium]